MGCGGTELDVGLVPCVCSVGRTERSALRALREQLFAHKSDLISAFQQYDPDNTGRLRQQPLV